MLLGIVGDGGQQGIPVVGHMRHSGAHLKIRAHLQAHAQVVVRLRWAVTCSGYSLSPALDRQAGDGQAVQVGRRQWLVDVVKHDREQTRMEAGP